MTQFFRRLGHFGFRTELGKPAFQKSKMFIVVTCRTYRGERHRLIQKRGDLADLDVILDPSPPVNIPTNADLRDQAKPGSLAPWAPLFPATYRTFDSRLGPRRAKDV